MKLIFARQDVIMTFDFFLVSFHFVPRSAKCCVLLRWARRRTRGEGSQEGGGEAALGKMSKSGDKKVIIAMIIIPMMIKKKGR